MLSYIKGRGDGTSRNDVSPYKCSGTTDPLDESSRKHNVPALIHPCHFAPTYTYCIMHNNRDVSCRDIVSPATINLGIRGPRKSVQGYVVSRRPVTPPIKVCLCCNLKCMYSIMKRNLGFYFTQHKQYGLHKMLTLLCKSF